MNRIFLFLIGFIIFNCSDLNGQLYFGNFVGEDSKTINGLASYEVPFGLPIPVKKFEDGKYKIIVEPSYTLTHTYFDDKWVFSTDGNTTTYALDPDPNHEYRKSIFSHQSKIVTWAWEAWMGFEANFGKVRANVFYAPSYIQVGSFRRKFDNANEVTKVRDKFREKADYYNINRFQSRVKASISYYGIGVGGFLNLTPFFNKSTDIDLRKFGLTLIIRDDFWENLLDLDNGENSDKEKKNPNIKEMMF